MLGGPRPTGRRMRARSIAAFLALSVALAIAGSGLAGARVATPLPIGLEPVPRESLAQVVGDGRGIRLARAGEARVRLHLDLPPTGPGDPPWVLRLERDTLAFRLESGSWKGPVRDFFAPRPDAGMLPGTFTTALPTTWSGPRTLDLVVAADAPLTLWPAVLRRDDAVRVDNRAIALAGGVYACLAVLFAIALSLAGATRDRVFLSLAAFLATSLAVLLAANGHLYAVPWLRWFGAWRMAGIWTLTLLAAASALLVLRQYAAVAERAPRLDRLLSALNAVLLALAALCLLNLAAGRAWLHWGVTAGWELATLGGMACSVVALRRGSWPGVPAALLLMQGALVVTGSLQELAMRGIGTGGFWIRHGYQVALVATAVVLAVGLTGRISEYRTARERDRAARDDSERRLRREATRAAVVQALHGLGERSAGDSLPEACRAVLLQLVPALRLRSAGLVARGWHGQDLLEAAPEGRRPHVTALVADRVGMMKGLARTRVPVQLPLTTGTAEAGGPEAGRARAVPPLGRLHAVVPLPIDGTGWAVMLLERDDARGFDPDELALAAEFSALLVRHADEAARALDLRRSAEVDSLTGTLNRRAIDERLAACFADAWARQEPVAVLFVDMDHFKVVNDTHGHASGDECLRALSDAMRQGLRPGDVLGRYGGEEFLILLPGRDVGAALPIAERIRTAIERTPLWARGRPVPMTVSVGVSARRPHERDPEAALARADRALYAAKRAGRNRVEAEAEDGPPPD